MNQPVNNLLRHTQMASRLPYDEEAYMPMPNIPRGAAVPGELLGPMGSNGYSVNRLLNERMHRNLGRPNYLTEYITGDDSLGVIDGLGYGIPNRYNTRNMRNSQEMSRGGGGSDMDMMQMYGPEDQVVFDHQGNPIPLADPRHPRNQQREQFAPSYGPPMYPQQRR